MLRQSATINGSVRLAISDDDVDDGDDKDEVRVSNETLFHQRFRAIVRTLMDLAMCRGFAWIFGEYSYSVQHKQKERNSVPNLFLLLLQFPHDRIPEFGGLADPAE